MIQTGSVHSEGAEIVYDTEGSGPPLLLIPGAGGDGSIYRGIAGILADDFTVITYDRRCDARSSGDAAADLDMRQQARDVVAVLRAAGHERGMVFGNSAGANIALQVASDRPASVAALIAHEPPAVALLPDADQVLAFVDRVYQTFEAQGALAAMRLFATSLVGFSGPVRGGLGQEKDLTFFFGKEYLNLTRFVPDLAAIRAAGVRAVALAGDQSGDAYYARTVPIIAERLGCPAVTVPGNHLAFLSEPGPFARALRGVLSRLTDGRPPQ